jgi:ABC-type nitrate/sulfonate/bicarbonate transport system substrate-binding protein
MIRTASIPKVVVASTLLLLVGCTSTSSTTTTTVALDTTGAPVDTGVTQDGISSTRCAANKAAGTISYLSSFDYATTASIVEVVVAKQKGYFEKMCLDVQLSSSFSTKNYPLVASNVAQISSAGSYVEQLLFTKDGAELVTIAMNGKVGADALLVRADGPIKSPADLKGKKIGVKGALPPAEVALLQKYGLQKGDYEEVSLQGFDPKQHWQQPIDALPVYKSNEPGQLDAAGIKYLMFDPAKEDIPSSFGLLYTNKKFLKEHPTAVEDFVRASAKGMEDALANPTEAVDITFAKVTESGNKNFLSKEGETYRWNIESKLLKESTPSKKIPASFTDADLKKQIDTYIKAGILEERYAALLPSTYASVPDSIIDSSGTLIWPKK